MSRPAHSDDDPVYRSEMTCLVVSIAVVIIFLIGWAGGVMSTLPGG